MDIFDQFQETLLKRNAELELLNGTVALFGRSGMSTGDIYESLVRSIPAAFKIPDASGAELVIGDACYRTSGYAPTENTISNDICINGQTAGRLSVSRSGTDRCDFLPEERTLLSTLATMIGCYQGNCESGKLLKETIEQLEQRGGKTGSTARRSSRTLVRTRP